MKKSIIDSYQLWNGVRIPCVGFGTWQAEEGDTAFNAVRTALEAGYRHVDTAAIYNNEASVGEAVKQSGIKREELFITSKLWNGVRGYNETLQAFEETLEKLKLDYLDMYLIHWPNPAKYRDCWEQMNADTWKAFERLYEQKKVRAIGISNFKVHHMKALEKTAVIKPMVNQIRICPGCLNEETVNYSREQGMLLEAYSPFGTGKIFESESMRDMAERYGRSIAQLCVNWSLEKEFLPLPKSVTAERIYDNMKVFDFELAEEDIKIIDALEGICGQGSDPDHTNF